MTLVNTETGEIVELDQAAAERRAERITLRLDSIADNTDAVKGMIREAIAKRDDMALGYRSLGDYVADRFGGSLARLGVEVRRAFVAELTEAGLSTRAIAPVVGASQKTVDRDVRAGESHDSPANLQTFADHMATWTPATPVQGDAPIAPAVATAPTAEPARPPVVGRDGKTYTRPQPSPKPVLVGNDAEYANAEKASLALTRAISKLLEFQHPNMRDGMRRYWSMASLEVPPTPRRDVTPEQMRVAAQGLLTLADEWDV